MDKEEKYIKINSEEAFLNLIKEPANHVQNITSLPRRGVGVFIEGVDFSYIFNPIVNSLKTDLISEKVIISLEKFISTKDNDYNIKFVQFINCKFDDSYKIFNKRNIDFIFSNCKFKKRLVIPKTDYLIEFINKSVFYEKVSFESTTNNIKFNNCFFKKELSVKDNIFEGKVRFRNCEFEGKTNFKNSSFNDLVDFWNSTFHESVSFYKTDFRDIVVMSGVTFKENVLFTYTLIDKLLILRGTYPKKGFDLSLAIISGELSLFDFQFDDYKSYNGLYKEVNDELKKSNNKISYSEAYEIVYENAVSKYHEIPIENKRETYRILKNQLESQKNFINAIPFKVMESKTHLKESWKKFISLHHTFTRPFSNMIVLSLNAISNWFGSSYIIGIIFTVSIASIFFNCMLSHIGDFVFTTDYSKWQWEYFVKFINPTHRFDFMKDVDVNPEKWFYIYDFLGRIFIGYGIYQTIQAFRKYR